MTPRFDTNLSTVLTIAAAAVVLYTVVRGARRIARRATARAPDAALAAWENEGGAVTAATDAGRALPQNKNLSS